VCIFKKKAKNFVSGKKKFWWWRGHRRTNFSVRTVITGRMRRMRRRRRSSVIFFQIYSPQWDPPINFFTGTKFLFFFFKGTSPPLGCVSLKKKQKNSYRVKKKNFGYDRHTDEPGRKACHYFFTLLPRYV